MANHVVFIDESGAFLPCGKPGFVAGWVCPASRETALGKRLREVVGAFNDERAGCPKREGVLYPEHLHLAPLLNPCLRNGADTGIGVPAAAAKILVRRVLDLARQEAVFVFRSDGRPVLAGDMQSEYLQVLRNTLVQLLENAVFKPETGVRVVLARRDLARVLAPADTTSGELYENYLSAGIAAELREAFPDRKFDLSVTLDSARKNPGLILADFVCGAFREGPTNWLAGFHDVRRYPFQNGYRILPPRRLGEVRELRKRDAAAAALLCLDGLCSSEAHEELRSELKSVHAAFRDDDRRRFYAEVRARLEAEWVEGAARYERIAWVRNLLDRLTVLLPNNPEAMAPDQLRLTADIGLNRIRLVSHSGGTNREPVRKHRAFLERFGGGAFRNRLELLGHRVETALTAAQVEAFNAFRFLEAEPALLAVREDYRRLFGDELSRPGVKDEHLARLEGTLGQVYAFEADLTGDGIWAEAAEECLRRDVALCTPGSPYHEMGWGYLTVLYWKRGDLDRAVAAFREEAGRPDAPDGDVFRLNADPFGCARNPFRLLHRLSLCALARQQGRKVTGLSTVVKGLLDRADTLPEYPANLQAKWAAVLLAQEGHHARALELTRAALTGAERNFTLELVRFPLRLLEAHLASRVGGSPGFSATEAWDRLKTLQADAGTLLSRISMEAFSPAPVDWDPYRVGTLLPFYFS